MSDYTDVRKVTCQLLLAVHEGMLDWEDIGRAALSYMSEYDVATMARTNELLPLDDDDDSDEDEDEEEAEAEEYQKFLDERAKNNLTNDDDNGYDLHEYLNDVGFYDD
jgi:hypothetical protein